MIVGLSEFTESALSEFRLFLDRIKSGSDEDVPTQYLEGEHNVSPIELSNGIPEIDTATEFKSRMDLGKYLSDKIETREDLSLVLDNRKAGAFLSLAFFESVCERRENGTWKAGAIDRFIPNLKNRQRFYRHNVFSPLAVFLPLHGQRKTVPMPGHPCPSRYYGTDRFARIAHDEPSNHRSIGQAILG